MRKLIIKIFVAVILALTIANVASYIVFIYFRDDYFTIKDFGWIKNLDEKPRIVLMGSSAVSYNVDPVMVSEKLGMKKGRIINLSTDAQTPLQSYYLAREILPQLDSVTTLFYSIDPWIFSEIYYRHDHLLTVNWTIRQRLFYMRPERIQQVLFGSRPEKVIRTFISRNRSMGINQPVPKLLGASRIPAGINVTNFNEPVEKWFEYGVFKFSGFQFEYLKKLKEYVTNRGIKFVILLTPKTDEWRNNYLEYCGDANRDFFELFNESVGDVYTAGSYDLIPKELQHGFFVDSIHLNEEGQKYFSEFVAGYIKSLDSLKKEKLTSFIR